MSARARSPLVRTATAAAGEVASFVSPFELQVVSPRRDGSGRVQDLQYAGVADRRGTGSGSACRRGATGRRRSDTSINIYVDNDLNGTWDRIIVNTNSGALSRVFFGAASTGRHGRVHHDGVHAAEPVLERASPPAARRTSSTARTRARPIPRCSTRTSCSSAPTPAQLGLANTNSPFRYKVVTCPGWAPVCEQFGGFILDEAAGPYFWNGGAQGLSFNGGLLLLDLNGSSIPVTWNTANMATNGSLGALLLHHYNAEGQRAQVVLLQGAQQTDLSVTMSASPTAPASGEQTVLTVTVTNNGPAAATGVDDRDGHAARIDACVGRWRRRVPCRIDTWTVGSLANGASATLHITMTADDTEFMQARALVSTATPIDRIAANNEAVITFNAPVLTDLRITSVPALPSTVAGNAFGVDGHHHESGRVARAQRVDRELDRRGHGRDPVRHALRGRLHGRHRPLADRHAQPGRVRDAEPVRRRGRRPHADVQSLASSGVTDPNTSNNVALASINVTTRATAATATLDTATVISRPGRHVHHRRHRHRGDAARRAIRRARSRSARPFPATSSARPSCVLAPVALTTDQSSCAVTITPAARWRPHALGEVCRQQHARGQRGDDADLTVDLRPTTTTAANATAVSSLEAQDVTLIANVIATAPVSEAVNAGTVTFTVRDAGNIVIGVPVTSAAPMRRQRQRGVSCCPRARPPQTLSITAAYSGAGVFAASSRCHEDVDCGAIAAARDADLHARGRRHRRVLRSRRAARESQQHGRADHDHVPQGGRHDGDAESHARPADAHDDPRRRDRRPRRDGGLDRRDFDVGPAAGRRAHDEMGCDGLRRAHRQGDAGAGVDVVLRGGLAGLLLHVPAARQSRRRGEHRARHLVPRGRSAARPRLRSAAFVAPHGDRGRRCWSWSIAPSASR